MKLDLSQAFQSYFTNAIVSVEEDTYAAVYALLLKAKQQTRDRTLIGYFDGKELHQVQSLGYIIMDVVNVL
jgi:hypothetical protein